MIKVENISYQTSSGKKLLDAISAEFHENKLNLIIGPNGAGKSTLLKILSGQLRKHHGNVFYNNKNLSTYSVQSLSKIRALLSQSVDLVFSFTVKQVVMMGRYPHFTNKPNPVDHEICKDTMQLFDIWNLADRNYMTLSGGEKQRVHFARVLSQIVDHNNNQTRFLILDEPLNSLDIYYQFDFMEKLNHLVKNQKIVAVGVVHDLNLVSKYADFVLLLNHGKLIKSGTKAEVLTTQNIKDVFKLDVTLHQEKDAFQILY